jgi:hypothetical protein
VLAIVLGPASCGCWRAAGQGPITVTSDPGLQFRAVDALVDLVDTLGLGGPLVLSVGDLQWTMRAFGTGDRVSLVGPDLVRLALDTGQQERAEQVATSVADLAATEEVPSFTGAALRCRGLFGRDPAMLLAVAEAYS